MRRSSREGRREANGGPEMGSSGISRRHGRSGLGFWRRVSPRTGDSRSSALAVHHLAPDLGPATPPPDRPLAGARYGLPPTSSPGLGTPARPNLGWIRQTHAGRRHNLLDSAKSGTRKQMEGSASARHADGPSFRRNPTMQASCRDGSGLERASSADLPRQSSLRDAQRLAVCPACARFLALMAHSGESPDVLGAQRTSAALCAGDVFLFDPPRRLRAPGGRTSTRRRCPPIASWRPHECLRARRLALLYLVGVGRGGWERPGLTGTTRRAPCRVQCTGGVGAGALGRGTRRLGFYIDLAAHRPKWGEKLWWKRHMRSCSRHIPLGKRRGRAPIEDSYGE